MATSLSGGRSQSTRREPPTMGKHLVSFKDIKQFCILLYNYNQFLIGLLSDYGFISIGILNLLKKD
jgi:hypothetical protein